MYSLEWMRGMAQTGDVHQSISTSWAKYIAGHLINLTNVNEQTKA